MLSVLRFRTYRRLFAAQVVALTGTGLATVALGLLAYRLAGPDAGAVLGTALAIKMVAYVTVAPLFGAVAGLVPRRALLVGLDVVRAVVALSLPFVSEIWHVYVLIFLLQSASAAFTPAFQATVPDVLSDEGDYTRALTLSRLAYDLETLLSPSLAALALLVVDFETLFVGTAVGFAGSALLILSVALPSPPVGRRRPLRGLRVYLATPRLRGLLAVHLAVAAAGSMVLVNTVVLVRVELGRDAVDVAFALAANGVGSLVAALSLPRVLERVPDRRIMLQAAGLLAGCMAAGVFVESWPALLVLWALMGAGGSLVLTPASRLLRRSAGSEDRPAVFAADFALSHLCWLVCYPLAGVLMTLAGSAVTFAVLGGVTLASLFAAAHLWPAPDLEVIEHTHPASTSEDHLHDAVLVGNAWRHSHRFHIDDDHLRWPR
ncbi:MFS transporter [Saccharothrix variisporea]|uniref:Putative MFS family arabinose efflux permease n=1 Tax=Saccharothrix variisporea TaxID=543527 RepID=A0A495XP65_9PSEU|nr:MFS transporter [Saccharothrix variisporea]RKT74253.1 putative MFS family arabinose efflux permease [Saccharothrix variisporea]